MKVEKVGSRGFVLRFDDGDTNFLINGAKTIYLCDTHMGPKSMDLVKEYIKAQNWKDKEIIIFNSHYHYDHIWGNCSFENEKIISHELCRDRMIERSNYDLERLKNMYDTEGIKIKIPNVTFTNKLEFQEDDIEFVYTPGHTDCSAMCVDKRDSVIYTNDLIEYPLPHLGYDDWPQYIKTLEFIKGLSPNVMVSTHSDIVDEKLLDENILYIKRLLNNDKVEFEDEGRLKTHNNNIKRGLIFRYENIIKRKLGSEFDYKAYKKSFWGLLGVEYQELAQEYALTSNTNYQDMEEAFKSFLNQITMGNCN